MSEKRLKNTPQIQVRSIKPEDNGAIRELFRRFIVFKFTGRAFVDGYLELAGTKFLAALVAGAVLIAAAITYATGVVLPIALFAAVVTVAAYVYVIVPLVVNAALPKVYLAHGDKWDMKDPYTHYTAPGNAFWVAVDTANDNEIVGCVGFVGQVLQGFRMSPFQESLMNGTSRKAGGAFRLIVNATYRRCGIAAKLMAAVEEHARSQDFVLLFLLTFFTNRPGMTLFKKLGYVWRDTFPYGKGSDLLGLRMCVLNKKLVKDAQ